MKPHPRIRKTIKWGGAAVTVLLVVVWIGSGKATIGHRDFYDRYWELSRGHIGYDAERWLLQYPIGDPRWYAIVEPTWSIDWSMWKTNWQGMIWPRQGSFSCARWQVSLWPFVVGATGVTAFAWRLDTLARRRAKLNHCPKCGYDRTGILQEAKCPECGSTPS